MTDDAYPFAVLAIKPSGARVLFARYVTRNAAEAAAEALRAHKMGAVVVKADGLPARPGASIPAPTSGRKSARVRRV